MLRVALTGGVGSGKSAAATMLRDLGAKLSQSDEVGRALMQPGTAVFAGIVARFGREVVAADGTLDRAMLARLAFSEGRIEELNGMIHPAVIRAQADWFVAVSSQTPEAVAVVESALIFETKHGGAAGDGDAPWRARFDRVVVLTAPLEVRRERYLSRVRETVAEGAASADFDRRVAAQWSDEQKAALADFVVVNDGSLVALQRKIAELYAVLRQESLDRAAEAM